ncbi:hypothetical protein OGAPHI_000982 [Ogataea philodendri]|uniref:Transcription factor CBF/NF-Y/archaeal histone domain-containing protein n=1 Tax=Ogataea philodendri TaxID=1378263 RepID=A0A9P8PFT1_9ASCO|nr:uncharacterized protein OGAPHI_000982 [Ogataea philodendri]KAH3670467.1 hypothetical protein OGAPHI_000982 [Ogataea philodendri]
MSDNQQPQDELSLPKATVQKIISEVLPSEFSFTKDAREALIECCIEFLMILSTESNDIADKELKKTISTDHVLKAVTELGFVDYLPVLEKCLSEFKETNKVKERKNSKFQNSGLSEEELLRQQEELFRASRNRLQQQNVKEESESVMNCCFSGGRNRLSFSCSLEKNDLNSSTTLMASIGVSLVNWSSSSMSSSSLRCKITSLKPERAPTSPLSKDISARICSLRSYTVVRSVSLLLNQSSMNFMNASPKACAVATGRTKQAEMNTFISGLRVLSNTSRSSGLDCNLIDVCKTGCSICGKTGSIFGPTDRRTTCSSSYTNSTTPSSPSKSSVSKSLSTEVKNCCRCKLLLISAFLNP